MKTPSPYDTAKMLGDVAENVSHEVLAMSGNVVKGLATMFFPGSTPDKPKFVNNHDNRREYVTNNFYIEDCPEERDPCERCGECGRELEDVEDFEE